MEQAIVRFTAAQGGDQVEPAVQPKGRLRRWLTFRMSTLLIAVTLAGCVLGLLAREVEQARRQARAVARLRSVGAYLISRTYEKPDGPFICNFPTPTLDDGFLPPEWIRHVMGAEFGMSVQRVAFTQHEGLGTEDPLDVGAMRCEDDDLECLQDLRRVQKLELDYTDITDDGLVHVGRLATVSHLSLKQTPIPQKFRDMRSSPNLPSATKK